MAGKKIPPISDEKRAKLRLKKEREKTKKKRKAEEEAAKPPTKKRKFYPKRARRDWAKLKETLVYNENGVGETSGGPEGTFAFFPKGAPAEKAAPAGEEDEGSQWMSLDFEGGRVGEDTEEEESEEEGEDGDMMEGVERGGGNGKGGDGGGGMGGGDPTVGVVSGVAGLVLSSVAVR